MFLIFILVQAMLNTKSVYELASLTLYDFLKMCDLIGTLSTEFALQQPEVQEIFRRNDTKNVYDD